MLGRQFVERGGDAWVVVLVTKFFHEVRGLWIQVVDQMPLVGGLRTEVVLNFDKNLVLFVYAYSRAESHFVLFVQRFRRVKCWVDAPSRGTSCLLT